MRLTSERVTELFMDCLFNDGEDTSNHVKVEGVINTMGFHPDRLEGHKDEIIELLNELSDAFKMSGGKGMSFLQACEDKHGNQWTGLHKVMEQLFTMGMGIDKVKCLTSREMWSRLPGGMPYYAILDEN